MRTMTKIVGVGCVALAALAAGCRETPGVAVVYAAQAPATVHPQWDPPPAGDAVTEYRPTLDGVALAAVPPTVDPACSCVRFAMVVPAYGDHVFTVVAVNQALSTDPASAQVSAPVTVPFRLSPPPGAPKNGKVGR